MKIGYSYQISEEEKHRTSKAMVRDKKVSFKKTKVLCDHIRGMMLDDAMEFLDAIVEKKESVPFEKHNKGVGHRKGKGPAKFPVKSAKHVMEVLRNLEANAEYKALDLENLKIEHLQAKEAVSRRRRKPKGRYQVWRTQLVNIEAIGKEIEAQEQ